MTWRGITTYKQRWELIVIWNSNLLLSLNSCDVTWVFSVTCYDVPWREVCLCEEANSSGSFRILQSRQLIPITTHGVSTVIGTRVRNETNENAKEKRCLLNFFCFRYLCTSLHVYFPTWKNDSTIVTVDRTEMVERNDWNTSLSLADTNWAKYLCIFNIYLLFRKKQPHVFES